ncbi:MAG: hypothetical protein JXM70_28555 [Pirellulales bacterium]|nr:hypothetical protein [Pirellulales bacterium]
MRRMALPFVMFTMIIIGLSHPSSAADAKKAGVKTPPDRVVVMYFHRTKRCPTCQRMGSYSEEAVKKGFPKEVKKRTVEFHYIDFQDQKNAALTKGYNVSGPALIVVKVEKNKAAKVNNLKEIWTKNNDKEAFLKYVRDNVKAYQPLTWLAYYPTRRTQTRSATPT